MKYSITEKKALKKLGIPDFRHMTKDKVVQFTSMIPKMDPEVAKAAIEQFPEFRGMTTDIVNACKEIVDRLFESNDCSQEQFYSACNSIINSLQKELEMPDLSSIDRDRIEKKMIEVAKMIGEKDSENKRFHRKIATVFALFGAAALATGAAILGTSSRIDTQDEGVDDGVNSNNDIQFGQEHTCDDEQFGCAG